MTDHDHDPLADRLRRAVTTLPAAEPDWPGTARRVRRARAARTAARIGIPAACALLAIGGVAVLSDLDGEQMSGSPATSVPVAAATAPMSAVTTAVATVAPPATVSTSVVPTTSVTDASSTAPASSTSMTDPSSWTILGRPSAFGTTLEIRAFAFLDDVCVAAAPSGAVPTWSWCGSVGTYGVRLLDGRLHVLGSLAAGSNVRVATTAGSADLPTFDAGGTVAFAAVLPDGAELVGVDGVAAPAGCPYRPMLTALAGSDYIGMPIVASVVRCAPGYAGLFLNGGSAGQGGGAVLEDTGDGWTVLNVGLVCESSGSTVDGGPSDPTVDSEACAALGWGPPDTASDTTAPSVETTPSTIGREPVGGQETIPTLPAA